MYQILPERPQTPRIRLAHLLRRLAHRLDPPPQNVFYGNNLTTSTTSPVVVHWTEPEGTWKPLS